ncbi:MAG: GT2 family glycosyltransferase, partial [Ilumatobacter sp.]
NGSLIDWVVLTRGDRPAALAAAVTSLRASATTGSIVVVLNGPKAGTTIELSDGFSDGFSDDRVIVVESAENLGVPGGRDLGLESTQTPLVGFLDDDARLVSADSLGSVVEQFATNHSLGAMSLRLVDEDGNTSRRHVPRRGTRGADRSGPVVTFLGGASIIRRSAYLTVGRYWADLVYGHEELDLAWRLIEHDYSIRYEADISVYHPHTEISRHADGWWRTGRNRVLIARRNLPAPVMAVHTLAWLAIGTLRAPGGPCRRRYVGGWFGAWRVTVDRDPMSWSTLLRLRRLGRFPIA